VVKSDVTKKLTKLTIIKFKIMNIITKVKANIKYLDRFLLKKKYINELTKNRVQFLKENGYLVLENFFYGEELNNIQQKYKDELEFQNNFELPCLSQTLIDDVKHKELIENHFLYEQKELVSNNITFDKKDFSNYEEVISKFKPSTLKTYLTNIPSFFPIWLNEEILDIIEEYMGLRPYLIEAYLRRNFPAKYKVMNHYWHRDTNHPNFLLKAFIFLSDCKITTGPHEYISGSINDLRISGKTYYTEEEISNVYPKDSKNRILSIVKAGTIIIEDTRGLHKATIPQEGFRDLGFAVFFPLSFLPKKTKPYYNIKSNDFQKLSNRQKSYIPSNYIN